MNVPTECLRGVAMPETKPAADQQPAHQRSYIHSNTKDGYLKRLRRTEGWGGSPVWFGRAD